MYLKDVFKVKDIFPTDKHPYNFLFGTAQNFIRAKSINRYYTEIESTYN